MQGLPGADARPSALSLILIPILIATEAQMASGPCSHWRQTGAGVCARPTMGGMRMTASMQCIDRFDFNLCCQVHGGDPCRDPEEESICWFRA